MVIAIILLIVAASMFAAVVLTKQWAMERNGIDLDHEAMETKDLDRFTSKQKMILGLLLVPSGFMFAVVVAYILAGIAVVAMGGSVAAR